MAGEDVTVFGEQLRRLDAQVGEHNLDEDGRADYQQALKHPYESAQRAVPRNWYCPEEVTEVGSSTLAAGRYALACVQARVAGVGAPRATGSPASSTPSTAPQPGTWNGRHREPAYASYTQGRTTSWPLNRRRSARAHTC